MVESFNARISDIFATTHFRSRDDLQTTIDRCQTLYNDHLPQKLIGHITPLQAMRIWQSKRAELVAKKPKSAAGLDN